MKTNLTLKSSLVLFALFFALSGCSLFKEPTLADKLEGTWKVSGIVGPYNGQTIDLWAILSGLSPCLKESTISFSNSDFSSYTPAGCKDSNGDSYDGYFFPSKGSYTVSDTGELTIVGSDGYTYTGQLTFTDNKNATYVVTESGISFTFSITKQ